MAKMPVEECQIGSITCITFGMMSDGYTCVACKESNDHITQNSEYLFAALIHIIAFCKELLTPHATLKLHVAITSSRIKNIK